MRRFWVFPLLFAGLFLGFQLLLKWISLLVSAILLPLMLSKTDVYFHTSRFHFHQYLPFTAFGIGVSLIFAALDFALHPEDPRGHGALRHLRKSWRLAARALGIMLINNFVLPLGLSFRPLHRRYHAYAPEFQFLNLFSLITPTFFLLLVGWAITQTLQRPRASAN